MTNVSLLPAPQLSTDAKRRLDELAEYRMLAPARRASYELRLVGATVLPQRQTIARTQWGTWLFVSHTDDPTAGQYGGRIPIPADQITRLTELDRHGVHPELVWIGHQLPASYREGSPVPRLVPVPRHLREKDERLKVQLAKATKLFLKGAGAILATAAATPLVVAGGIAAGTGLDPIILGGVRHPELPLVEWCLLAQWEWE